MDGGGVRIERIANSKLREAVFRRRKNGLLRRAMELSVMTNCDVAVLVFHGTTGQLTQYSSAPIGGLLQRFARACSRPHETYTNEDLYTHHVLAQLAEDGEEAQGTGVKRSRNLPSFWAAKAELERRERQRQAQQQAVAVGRPTEQGSEEEWGQEGAAEGPLRGTKRKRTAAEGSRGEGRQQDGQGEEGEEPKASDYSELDRQAAALADLAEEAGCQLSPRSRHAYQRISREFDRLMSRAREEMETAEALAAVAEEPAGPAEEAEARAEEKAGQATEQKAPVREELADKAGADGPAGSAGQELGAAAADASAPASVAGEQAMAAAAAAGGKVEDKESGAETGLAPPPAMAPAAGTPHDTPASPPSAATSPSSLEPAHPAPSLAHSQQQLEQQAEQQQQQQKTPSPPAMQGTPAAAAATLAPSATAIAGVALPRPTLPGGAAAQQQQQQQNTPAALLGAAALPPAAGLATANPQPMCMPGAYMPQAAGSAPQQAAAARLQLQAFPRGGSFVFRPVAVPMMTPSSAAAGGGSSGPMAHHPGTGMMFQLQPIHMQPAQLQQYQRLVLQQQQQLAAMQAAATKQAQLARLQQARQAQQAQQQQQQVPTAGLVASNNRAHPQPSMSGQPGQEQAQHQALKQSADALVLPIVSQPHHSHPPPELDHDPIADMLA